MLFKKENQYFIENYFTPLWLVMIGFCSVLVVLPFIFKPLNDTTLVTIQGHLSDLKIHTGTSNFGNVFLFTLKERPELSFEVDGLRVSDQNLLVNWEAHHDEFSVEVSSKELAAMHPSLHVYGLSTASNVFLSSGDISVQAWKARLFLIILCSLVFIAVFWMVYWLRQQYRIGNFEQQPIDSILIFATEHPKGFIGGGLSSCLLLSLLLFPSRFVTLQFLFSVVGYGGFFYWHRTHPAGIRWFAEIRGRHQRQIAASSANRLVTVAPKHVKAVQALLRTSGTVDVQDKKGRTPLYVASGGGESEAVSLLLKHGANVNLANLDGNTPLMAASDKGHMGIVMKLMSAGAKVTFQNKKGLTALMMAQLSKKNKALLDFLATSELKEKIAESKAARTVEEQVISSEPAKTGLTPKREE